MREVGTERPRIRAPPSGNAGHTRANSGKLGAHPWGKLQKGNGGRLEGVGDERGGGTLERPRDRARMVGPERHLPGNVPGRFG